MAEPLTSSDIINLRMGFGPSSPEERKRVAGAGILPLSAMEREKFERGGGLSPMASQAEKEAWVAAEAMTGRRSQMELPESYGGMGERPKATTRRGFRMQQEWDKQREMMMEDQKIARELEQRNKQMEAYDLDVRLKERELSVAREEDIFNKSQQERTLAEQEQAFKAINAVRGQPNAYEAASEAISGLPFAAASAPVQKALEALGQARDLEGAAKMAAEQKELAGEVREARQLGLTDKDLATTQDINPETGEVFTDRGRLQKLIDETKGKRTLKREGREEEKDEYRPMSVEQAKDQFDIAKAEFDSVSGSFEEEDDEYKKADARLRRAEAQLKVSQGRTESKKEAGYEVGKSYRGMIYIGGDPNSESSWKKK